MLVSITVKELGTCNDRECKTPTYNFIPDAAGKSSGYYYCLPCTWLDQEAEANHRGS